MRRSARILVAAAVLHAPAPTAAQVFGQWAWSGDLAAQARYNRNFIGAREVSRYDQDDLRLTLGIEGFLLHPAFAQFRLDGGFGLTRWKSGGTANQRIWSLGSTTRVLPQGAYPLTLYARRSSYDYSRITLDDPLSLRQRPDAATVVGGRLRIRRGLLRGTLVGFDQSWVSALGEAPSDSLQTAFAAWSGASRRFQRSLRADWRAQDFGYLDFANSDVTASYNQRGDLSPVWRWEWTTTGIHRNLDYQAASTTLDSWRMGQSFQNRRNGGLDTLELRYDSGIDRSSDTSFQSHNLGARYTWQVSPSWNLGPFVSYGLQRAAGATLHAPGLGARATWSTQRARTDLTFTNSLAYLLLIGSGGTNAAAAVEIGGTFGHGTLDDLRKSIELSWALNHLREAGDATESLPGLGIETSASGTENRLRARVSLGRRWRSWTANSYVDATRRDPSGVIGRRSPGYETLTGTLQISGRALGLSASGGLTRTLAEPAQESTYLGSTVWWRPFRVAALSASYRSDRRSSTLAPPVDAGRWEGNLDVFVGAFVLRTSAFDFSEHTPTAATRTNRGLTVSLSRRFAGWLPIVTGNPGYGSIK